MKPILFIIFGTLSALAQGPLQADEKHRFSLSPAYQEECGTCHIAYPPGLLPRSSWKAIMAGLERHFGSDASLDGAKAREISAFLAAGAGREDEPGRAPAGVTPRISATPWFLREHRDGHDGLRAAVWQAVKSPANCGACHQGAADGDYSERNIRIPR